MSAADRLADDYEPRWDLDAAEGRVAERFVCDIIDALEDGASIEVKNDVVALRTRNAYMEVKCWGDSGSWHDSGLARTEAELWAHVLGGDVAVIAPVWKWRAVTAKRWTSHGGVPMDRGSHPSVGVLLPLSSVVSDLMAAQPADDPRGGHQ